jgi:hypothetical protein
MTGYFSLGCTSVLPAFCSVKKSGDWEISAPVFTAHIGALVSSKGQKFCEKYINN